jgi:hypothetical protein
VDGKRRVEIGASAQRQHYITAKVARNVQIRQNVIKLKPPPPLFKIIPSMFAVGFFFFKRRRLFDSTLKIVVVSSIAVQDAGRYQRPAGGDYHSGYSRGWHDSTA